MTLLQVSDLRVRLQTPAGPADAVRGVSFALGQGETLGLVGESGCGKSLTALALMGLLPEGAQTSGQIQLHGQDLTQLSEQAWRKVRGRQLAMVFQEPMTALNPLHTVGHQVAEPLRLHKGLARAAARQEARRLLDRVGIADAGRRLDAYPHQFSGGQRQRITLAMALACGPELLIADEPTTALDVTVASQILQLLRELIEERGMGLLLISHDLGVIAQNTARMLVMYGGTVVEQGSTREVFTQRRHPYTQGLFASRPHLHPLPTDRGGQRLMAIPGSVPELHQMPGGCPFAGRCAVALPVCATQAPVETALSPSHSARCVLIAPA
ncbi:MAG: hypothetical protein RLZZ401_1604 [Pseudomonadota bacterium]